MKQITPLVIILLVAANCSTPARKTSDKDDYYRHEEAAMDYYLKRDTKAALRKLDKSCRKKNSLSCYNLAVLYDRLGDTAKSLDAATDSVKISPEDPLSISILYHVSAKAKNYSVLQKYYPELYRQITEEDKQKLPSLSRRYYRARAKENPFHEIWDTGYRARGLSVEHSRAQKKITGIWKEFKSAVRQNNKPEAERLFGLFIEETRIGARSDKKELYDALAMAARLLVEQDSFFKNFRYLVRDP